MAVGRRSVRTDDVGLRSKYKTEEEEEEIKTGA